jgi:hypothetical protein
MEAPRHSVGIALLCLSRTNQTLASRQTYLLAQWNYTALLWTGFKSFPAGD